MDILDALISSLPANEIAVRRVVAGRHWTAVCSKGCGLAATLSGEGSHGQGPVRDVGRLHKKSAHELAAWIHSDNLLEASIGMAAVNSLLEVDVSQAVEINAAEVLARKGKGKNIAVVGHFPFVERLRTQAKALWVIEKQPQEDDLPEQAAADILPQADIAAITGTTLINHTLQPLLNMCSPSTLVMILGPSTPLSPVLFSYGVHLIAGTLVTNETAALHTVEQGGVFPQVQGVHLLTLAAPGAREQIEGSGS